MMHMTYYNSADVTLLLSTWSTGGDQSYYVISLIAIFIISYLYESFSIYVNKFRGPPPSEKSEDDSSVPLLLPGSKREVAVKHSFHRVLGAVLHALHCFYSYNLMLLAMTYNIGVVAAICCGFGLGFYLHVYGSSHHAHTMCH